MLSFRCWLLKSFSSSPKAFSSDSFPRCRGKYVNISTDKNTGRSVAGSARPTRGFQVGPGFQSEHSLSFRDPDLVIEPEYAPPSDSSTNYITQICVCLPLTRLHNIHVWFSQKLKMLQVALPNIMQPSSRGMTKFTFSNFNM